MNTRNDCEVASTPRPSFTCEACGSEVYRPAPQAAPATAKCYVCQFLGTLKPEAREEARRRLRGDA